METSKNTCLKMALHSLWFQATTLRVSGALALLEPRVVADGPSIRTDGNTLWVSEYTLGEWLKAPPSSDPSRSLGVEALVATGLSVLYEWRGEPGPWVKPLLLVDPVVEVDRDYKKADWLWDQLMGHTGQAPDEGWPRAQWWASQVHHLGERRGTSNKDLEPPPGWSSPLVLGSQGQAESAWWRAVRGYLQIQGAALPESEALWINHCLEERPQELGEWMAIEPPVSVSYSSLFQLREPGWIEEFLKRGAHPEAISMGQTAAGMAASLCPRMVVPLLKAGVDPGMPAEELLLTMVLAPREGHQEIGEAIQACRDLMGWMEQIGQPMRWEERIELVAPLLSRSMEPAQSRAMVLQGLWPQGVRLDALIPQVETITGRRGGTEVLPLSHAVAVWVVDAIQEHHATMEDLAPRLQALEKMGVDFSFVSPKGGVFHRSLLRIHQPSTAEILYFALEPFGADWKARNEKGQLALEQKEWDSSEIRKKLREELAHIPSIEAHLLSVEMGKTLQEPEEPIAARKRF